MKRIMLLLAALLLTACAQKHSFVMLEQTAVDQGSGLVWARNANLPGRPLLWKAEDNVYSFIQKLNSDLYAGYADWRVPTREEMAELVAYAKSLGYQEDRMESWPYRRLTELGFVNVRDYDYWTSSRPAPDQMWIADLASGRISAQPDNKPFCLWPVRGSSR
jgi:uncharacterized protein DUF1566